MNGIESWMISLAISIVGLIAMIAVGKYKTEQNKIELDAEIDARKAISKKLDTVAEIVTEHKVRLHNVPSMEHVRNEFMSKEMFKQFEKHIDDKFDTMGKSLIKLGSNQELILEKLDKMKG